MLLLNLCERFGRRTAPNSAVIELPLTQDDLAGLVLTSKRTVARILQQWRDGGWIATRRRSVAILDLKALGRIA